MARFFGSIDSRRTHRSRPVHRLSDRGMTVTAASWHGAVRVTVSEANGKTIAHVALVPWQGVGVSRLLYEGPVDAALRAS